MLLYLFFAKLTFYILPTSSKEDSTTICASFESESATFCICRPKNYCWRIDPVCEEATGCDDSHLILSGCLRSGGPPAIYGQPATEVRLMATKV